MVLFKLSVVVFNIQTSFSRIIFTEKTVLQKECAAVTNGSRRVCALARLLRQVAGTLNFPESPNKRLMARFFVM